MSSAATCLVSRHANSSSVIGRNMLLRSGFRAMRVCQQTIFGVELSLVGQAKGQLTAGIVVSDDYCVGYRFVGCRVGCVGRAGRCGPRDRLGQVSTIDWRVTLTEALNAPGSLGTTYTRFYNSSALGQGRRVGGRLHRLVERRRRQRLDRVFPHRIVCLGAGRGDHVLRRA
jgi:hypothetical protein